MIKELPGRRHYYRNWSKIFKGQREAGWRESEYGEGSNYIITMFEMGNWNSDCPLSLFIHFTFSLYSDHQGLFFCPLNSINTSFTCLPAGCPALLFLSHLIHADLYALLLSSVRLICPLIHSSILFFQSWVRERSGKLILKKYSECRKEKKARKKTSPHYNLCPSGVMLNQVC